MRSLSIDEVAVVNGGISDFAQTMGFTGVGGILVGLVAINHCFEFGLISISAGIGLIYFSVIMASME